MSDFFQKPDGRGRVKSGYILIEHKLLSYLTYTEGSTKEIIVKILDWEIIMGEADLRCAITRALQADLDRRGGDGYGKPRGRRGE